MRYKCPHCGNIHTTDEYDEFNKNQHNTCVNWLHRSESAYPTTTGDWFVYCPDCGKLIKIRCLKRVVEEASEKRMKEKVEKKMENRYACPKCGKVHTTAEWDARYLQDFPNDDTKWFKSAEEDGTVATSVFTQICPSCGVRSKIRDIFSHKIVEPATICSTDAVDTPAKKYKCPNCGKVHTAKEWDTGLGGPPWFQNEEKDGTQSESIFDVRCPNCKKVCRISKAIPVNDCVKQPETTVQDTPAIPDRIVGCPKCGRSSTVGAWDAAGQKQWAPYTLLEDYISTGKDVLGMWFKCPFCERAVPAEKLIGIWLGTELDIVTKKVTENKMNKQPPIPEVQKDIILKVDTPDVNLIPPSLFRSISEDGAMVFKFEPVVPKHFINPTSETTKKIGGNFMTNLFKGMGEVNTAYIKSSIFGLAMRNGSGEFVTYADGELKDVSDFLFPADRIYAMPTKDIQVGDIIMRPGTDVAGFVTKVNEGGTYEMINPVTQTVETYLPKKWLNFAIAFKLVSMMTLLTGDKALTGSTESLLPLLMMGESGDMNSMLPMLLLSKGDDGCKLDTTMLLAMSMMNGGTGDMSSMLPLLLLNGGDGKLDTTTLLAMTMMNKKK